ncbi:MAG: ATP-binding cassette domain-containing protein [Syntrophomonadaceae bacterium]|jgi:putative ABC transport system ATP-binding protein|nr:ATP-binding cassette domain-containing protein [Syntrophomonadaceae bacterium]
MFKFEDITYHFDGGDRTIQVSGAVEEGGALALRGPSGAGKSTVLRILARLLQPVQGTVIFQGRDWYSISPMTWRRRVHYLPQRPVMFSGSVLDNLKRPFELVILKNQEFDQGRAERLLRETGLSLEMMHQDAHTLSGGEMARVALVRAMLVEPEVLLLDEPTAFLDEGAERLVLSLLIEWLQERSGRALIIVSHSEDELNIFPSLQVVDIATINREGVV